MPANGIKPEILGGMIKYLIRVNVVPASEFWFWLLTDERIYDRLNVCGFLWHNFKIVDVDAIQD